MGRRVAPWTLFFVSAAGFSANAQAGLSENCAALGEAMVEHSCFHSTFGPFVSVAGTPGTKAAAATPNLDAVHTEYRVGLAVNGEKHVATYSPKRSGSWSVFTSYAVPLELIDSNGASLDVTFEQQGDTGCDALPIARVFTLEAGERYTLRFGPSDDDDVIVVIEYADDFLVRVGRDADGDGYGSGADSFVSNCAPPEGFAPNTSDCDDGDPDVHPGAPERCGDDVDSNCNGSVDDVGLQCRSGAGACLAVGTFTCDGEVATCGAEPAEPEEEICNGKDDNCDGVIDDGGDELCSEADQPRCVRLDFGAFCGCLLDADCGGLNSGRVCNVETATCHDGCSLQAGGNTCPKGQRCEAEGGVGFGVCLDDAPKPKPEPDSHLRGVEQRSDADGCTCRAPRSSATGGGMLWGLAAVSVAVLRRRRSSTRRKPSLLAVREEH